MRKIRVVYGIFDVVVIEVTVDGRLRCNFEDNEWCFAIGEWEFVT